MILSNLICGKLLWWRRGVLRQVSTRLRSTGPESVQTREDTGTYKLRMFSDQDERRGYNYDSLLNLTGLLDRNNTIGHINTCGADGFKARNLRTGAESPDPIQAKETIRFFRKRQKLTKSRRGGVLLTKTVHTTNKNNSSSVNHGPHESAIAEDLRFTHLVDEDLIRSKPRQPNINSMLIPVHKRETRRVVGGMPQAYPITHRNYRTDKPKRKY